MCRSRVGPEILLTICFTDFVDWPGSFTPYDATEVCDPDREHRGGDVELTLTSDQKIFAETTRSYLADTCPTSALREKRDDGDGFHRSCGQQGAEFGWTSLLVDEKDGGGSISGRGVKDLTLLGFEFGRFAAPGPLASANVVVGALARSGSDEHKSGLLAELIAGEKLGTWAFGEPRPNDGFGTVTLEATRSGDGYVLSGRKLPVE